MSVIVRDAVEKDFYYKTLAQDLFTAQKQLWVPFLGAGVSASGRPPVDSGYERESKAELDEAEEYLANKFKLSSRSLFFIRSTLELALELEELKDQARPNLENVLRTQTHAPTSAELTELFRTASGFEWPAADLSQHLGYKSSDSINGQSVSDTARDLLDQLAPLAGVSAPPLPTMAACYELFHGRDRLLQELVKVMSNKNVVTRTHELIAQIAKRHVSRNKDHFFIITTNYDFLMEKALEGGPAYMVLSTNNSNFHVKTRFGNMDDDLREKFEAADEMLLPKNYVLPGSDHIEHMSKPLIVVYKLHGCINELQECPRMSGQPEKICLHDGIILSDKDYLKSIAHLHGNGGIIPAAVGDRLREKPILFLGYSLSDWNVRGLLQAFRNDENPTERSARKPDLAVARRLSLLEQRFYEGNHVDVLVEDLNTFSPRLQEWAAKNVI